MLCLISAIQQNDSVKHTYILFHILSYYGLSPNGLNPSTIPLPP